MKRALNIIFYASLIFTTFASHHSHHEEDHHHHHPQPYHFGYEVKDHHGSQFRHEEGDGHSIVKGSYGYTDHKGIHRVVNYVADHHGFRAEVKTNEPGTANEDSAHVKVHANPSSQHHYENHHHENHDTDNHGHVQVYHHQKQPKHHHHGHDSGQIHVYHFQQQPQHHEHQY